MDALPSSTRLRITLFENEIPRIAGSKDTENSQEQDDDTTSSHSQHRRGTEKKVTWWDDATRQANEFSDNDVGHVMAKDDDVEHVMNGGKWSGVRVDESDDVARHGKWTDVKVDELTTADQAGLKPIRYWVSDLTDNLDPKVLRSRARKF